MYLDVNIQALVCRKKVNYYDFVYLVDGNRAIVLFPGTSYLLIFDVAFNKTRLLVYGI